MAHLSRDELLAADIADLEQGEAGDQLIEKYTSKDPDEVITGV